jgi:sulfite reductase (ferredoxin)
MGVATVDVADAQIPLRPAQVRDELDHYEEQIRKYRAGELDETKMQKQRLHFGTYAQRQEGVQMQRIKIPGGFLTADQLTCLGDAAESFGSGFIHFTAREDAQIYYVKLDETPALLRFLADAGITSREACGNTVRNITACYRAGTAPDEAFDVTPYADALFRFLVRNKYNQNLGRKFKITFEGCAEDHSALRIHDIGLWATTRVENGAARRGFRVYLGGGLGSTPQLAQLYSDFLPADELFNLAAAALRLFDRYGERKARMKARMKFLIQSMGWEAFRAALDEERERVGPIALGDYLQVRSEPIPRNGRLPILNPAALDPAFQAWVRDSVIEHKHAGFRGVHVRVKLGDLTSARARELADVARRFSASQLRISIEQNIYLPWVHEPDLHALYQALAEISLADRGANTVADVTTCPGSDTCRLGIASAKGLGSEIATAFDGPLAKYAELARPLRVKISGCPNGCVQHAIANIGFYAAAMTHDDRTVPAHLLMLGGEVQPEKAQFGRLIGKFPAKNCVKVIDELLGLYDRERTTGEEFNSFLSRTETAQLKDLLEPLRLVPSFADDPTFYEDYGHEHERFAVRPSLKGECAGSTVAEEYEHAARAAYDCAGAAARVPLYRSLVDPFTADEALWEFENLYVLSGQTKGEWQDLSTRFALLRDEGIGPAQSSETSARELATSARTFVDYCASFTTDASPILSIAC